MEKTISIGSKAVRMRTSARVPYDYRFFFGGDILREMAELEKGTAPDFGMFERLAWIMARNAGEPVHAELPPTEALGEWLAEFDGCMDIIDAASDILALWRGGEAGASSPKKG